MFLKCQMVVLLVGIAIAVGNLERIRSEREIKAYGLPKRFLKSSNSGAIERIHLGTRLNVTAEDGNKFTDVTYSMTPKPLPSLIYSNKPHELSSSDLDDVENYYKKVTLPIDNSTIILSRRQRSIHDDDSEELSNDLDGAEAKIFRPLFVYRQQMAQRHAVKRSENPIYGAYQFKSNNKKSNHVKKMILH